MSETPNDLKFAKTHEWARIEDNGSIRVGISDNAQSQLGDMVYIELPEIGQVLAAGDSAAVVESVKAASDVYSPIAGEVIGINETLETSPELVNQSPYSDGWLYLVNASSSDATADLLSADDYTDSLDAE